MEDGRPRPPKIGHQTWATYSRPFCLQERSSSPFFEQGQVRRNSCLCDEREKAMRSAHPLMENRWLSLVIASLVLVLAATLFSPHSMRAPATLSESKPLSAPTQTYIPSDRARDL